WKTPSTMASSSAMRPPPTTGAGMLSRASTDTRATRKRPMNKTASDTSRVVMRSNSIVRTRAPPIGRPRASSADHTADWRHPLNRPALTAEPPSLPEQAFFGRSQALELRVAHLRIREIERGQGLDHRRRHHHSGEPLVVRGHDVPRRSLGRRVANHVLVRLHVVVPVPALLDVARGELPVLLGLLDATQEALALLLLGDVEEELADDDPIAGEIALEGADVLEAVVPDVLGDELARKVLLVQQLLVHANDQRLLVVA